MSDFLKKLLIAALVAILGGSGWAMYFVKQQDAKRAEVRAEARQALNGFLWPLRTILEQNRRVHSVLTQDPGLQSLEISPGNLRGYFESLPDTDWRKIGWENLIRLLLSNNEQAIRYIKKNSGLIVLDQFRQCSDEFIEHATLWAATFRYVVGDQPTFDEIGGENQLLTPEYPDCMDPLLGREIEVEERASQSAR